jgi:hypothetical protein
VLVNITPADIKKCRLAAARRINERIAKSSKYKPSDFDKLWKSHYPGAIGEWAVCKACSCEWTGEYFGAGGPHWDTRKWDVEVGEVRTTTQPHKYGGMRLYPTDDRPEAAVVWVNLQFKGTREGAMFAKATLVGWYYEWEGQREEWWHSDIGDSGAWVVPREFLKPMETLPTQI